MNWKLIISVVVMNGIPLTDANKWSAYLGHTSKEQNIGKSEQSIESRSAFVFI